MTLRRILSAVFVPLFLFMAVAFPMEKSYATESLNLLPSDINLNDKVGKQPSYNENDPYSWACASYCVAYAKAIIDGQKHNPKEYWSTPTSGSVDWTAGNYNRYKWYSSIGVQTELLKDVYNELKAGRLPIIYVTLYYSSGGSYSKHWALVVGYQNVNVDNLDSLTEKNFIAIDSNQPQYLKTLGETYPIGQSSLKLGNEIKARYSDDTVHKHSYTGPYKNDTEHWWQCSCGAKAKIAAHTFGDWTITKGASTTETGTKTRKCSGTGACGYEQTAVIPVLTFTHTNAKVKMNYPVNIKKTPYASGESVDKCYVDETFDIGAYGLNSYGNVWYQILNGPYAGNYIYSGETELVKYVNDLSITAIDKIPANIVQGTVCSPSETITSRHNITKVTGAIYSAETYKLIYSGSVSPNVHDSYSTANTAITEALKFHLLAPGKYIYVVTAAAEASLDFQAKGSANGKGITCLNSETFNKSYSKGFTVSAAPHEHTYGDWSKDGTNHWHECACGDKTDVAAHVYDDDADTTCNTCGYVRSITPPTHEHTYGDWSKDGTNHWHECACGDKTDVAAHSFGEWTVTKEASTTEPGSKTRSCSVCGFEETLEIPVLSHTHSYGTDWKNNETSHWHECTCGDKADVAEHSFGEWTVTKEASTTEPGSKTRSCSVCGFEETLEIPVLSHTHSYGTDWKNNETSHWHECTCGDKADVAEHSFGEWTVTKEASTTEPGSKTRSCSVCGFEETLEIPVLSHTHSYGTDWKNNETSHWHECTCGDKADMAAHSFRWIIDRAATATQKGSKHEECTVCGYRRAAVEIPATGTTTGGTTGTPGGGHSHYYPTTTPVPVIVIPPKTGDMTIWQSILRFLGIR